MTDLAKDALNRQRTLQKYIVNFAANSAKVAKHAQSAEFFKSRLTLLESYWAEFARKNLDLLSWQDKLAGDDYFKQDHYTVVEDVYIDTKVAMQQKISSLLSAPSAGAAGAGDQRVVVAGRSAFEPKMDVPKFSGGKDD